MRKISVLTFIVIINNLFGQTNDVKEIFFDLPLDKPKNEIASIVASDTIKFKIYSTIPEELFRATPKQKSKFLPKSHSDPTLTLIDKELQLTLYYTSQFNTKRKAKRAFKILADRLSGSFSRFSDSEPNPGFDYSLLAERKFYLVDKTEPKCTIKLEVHLGVRKLTISYFL